MSATPDFMSDPSQLDKYGMCHKCKTVFQLPLGKADGDDCFCNQCGTKMSVSVAKASLVSHHVGMLRQQVAMPSIEFQVMGDRLLEYNGMGPMATIPDGVVEIGDYVFSKKPVGMVKAPSSLRRIGFRSFGECDRLEAVQLPDTLEAIGAGAFQGCSALKFFTVPNGVRTIEQFTFCGCTSLVSVILPATVQTIDSYAFAKCPSLAMVALPPSVTSVAPDAFDPTTKVIGDPR